jgi:DNA mismatch endonuclease (patch repair protein)
MDIVNKDTRSRIMSGIRSKNTKPELLVRHLLFSKGFRYRICNKKLPGSPDIVLKKYKAVIFIHGCFWHGHDCSLFRVPSTRTDFWLNKIDSNRKRDHKIIVELKELGWRICIVWECAIRGKKNSPRLEDCVSEISEWLRSGSDWREIKK